MCAVYKNFRLQEGKKKDKNKYKLQHLWLHFALTFLLVIIICPVVEKINFHYLVYGISQPYLSVYWCDGFTLQIDNVAQKIHCDIYEVKNECIAYIC